MLKVLLSLPLMLNFAVGCKGTTGAAVKDETEAPTEATDMQSVEAAPTDSFKSLPRGANGAGETAGGKKFFRHDEGHKAGIFHTYDALDLGDGSGPRKIHVFLPRSFETGAGKRYPVLYLNDGQNVFFDNGSGNWDVARSFSEEQAAKQLPEMIIIGVHFKERFKEYTHARFRDEFPDDCCKAEAYAAYLAKSLKPFIDATYPTRPESRFNAIGGSSLGGLVAFIAGAQQGNAFGHVIAMSPAFWVGAGNDLRKSSSSVVRLVDKNLRAGTHPSLWIDWGVTSEGEGQAIIDWASRAADIMRADYKYTNKDLASFQDKQGGHRESSWAGRMRMVYPWLKTQFGPLN